MPKPNNHGILKPYNIVVDEGGNSARVDMYGEVVSARPVDWWTGEPMTCARGRPLHPVTRCRTKRGSRFAYLR